MALFAKSKVERFHDENNGSASNIGPGDYNPTLPRSNTAGAVSLGFTAAKGLPREKKSTAESIPEESESSHFAAAREKQRERASCGIPRDRRSTGGLGFRAPLASAASRLERVEAEQHARQLSWNERERQKLEAEVAKLRLREATLLKSERQARADAANAVAARDALSKKVDAAERKASCATADVTRLETASADASRLAEELEEAERAADEAADARIALQDELEYLKPQVVVLQERIEGLADKETRLGEEAVEAREREARLEQNVGELEAASKAAEEELREARASTARGAAREQEATEKAAFVGTELAAVKADAQRLEELSCRLGSELDERGRLLEASEGASKALGETIESLRAKGHRLEKRARGLERELKDAKAALGRAADDATSERLKLSAAEASRDELQERLERVEGKLSASSSEKSRLERSLTEEKFAGEALERELDSMRKTLATANCDASLLEDRLGSSELENARLREEHEASRSQLAASDETIKSLEVTMEETTESVAALQQRLGDALGESVEYADQAIRSEERLRSSEADCAALWEEREEAKEHLCAAFVQGRALEEQLDESMADVARLQEALRVSEARLTSSIEDGDEFEEELAASREEIAAVKKDLERVTERHVTACSEARLLKASRDDKQVEVAGLEKELETAESRFEESTAEAVRLKSELAISQAQKEVVKTALMEAFAQVDTAADDFVALESQLRDTERTCDRLRTDLESTEMRMSEVTAEAGRTRDELHGVLRKCTDLQERFSVADDRLASVTCERLALEEGLSESASRCVELERSLQEVQKEAAEAAPMKELLAATKESLEDALVGRSSAVSRVSQLEAELANTSEEMAAVREAHRAAGEKAEKYGAMVEALEMRMGEADSQVDTLRAAVTDRDARLEEANAAAADHKGRADAYEVEGARLLGVLDDIEANYAAGEESSADIKQELVDIHGIGVQLGERLTTVLSEKNSSQRKLEIVEAALAASAAHRRRLERDLETGEKALQELSSENAACQRKVRELREGCNRLEEAGHMQALGSAALIEESAAREHEAVSRLQLLEVTSAKEIALAKQETERVKEELRELSAEISETRATSDGLHRAQTEADLANRHVQRLASENAALAGHTNAKQKIKHLQDLKKQNIRLLNDSAALASELELATSVLEAIGVISKDEPGASKRGQDEAGDTPDEARRGRALHPRGSAASSSLSPVRGDSERSWRGFGSRDGRKMSRRRGVSLEELDPATPRSKSQRPRVSLQDRLLHALETAESPLGQRHSVALGRSRSKAKSTGCFGSIKSSLANLDGTVPAPVFPTTGIQLIDEGVRNDVRRALLAQTAGRSRSYSDGPE